MRPYLRLGVRNITQSKGRTAVTLLLSAFSTAVLIFSTAFMDGQHRVMLKNAVETYPGYIQITHENFRDNPGYENLIENSDTLVQRLQNDPRIGSISQRFETYVLLSTKEHSVGAMIAGIQPQKEQTNSILAKSLHRGKYLQKGDGNAIYLGSELAKNLQVKVGDTLAYIGNGVDYSFCADNVVVKGIFQTGLFQFDASSAFVSKEYFDHMFVSDNLATHIVIYPADIDTANELAQKIKPQLPPALHVQSWKEFMHTLVQAMELDSIFGYITLAIFFIVIFFVILIYTLLNIFARTREIGVLRAIGTGKKQIMGMLLFESTVLSFAGVLAGGAIGAALAYYFNLNPIELGAEFEKQFKQYGLVSSALPTTFEPLTILRDMGIMFVLCMASTLYPIVKINAMNPVEAMHHV